MRHSVLGAAASAIPTMACKHPVKRIKFWDKNKAIELGFRYFGLIREFGLDAGEERLQSLTVVFVNAKEGKKASNGNGSAKRNGPVPKKVLIPVRANTD